jgi:hypothetical protein
VFADVQRQIQHLALCWMAVTSIDGSALLAFSV